MKQKCFILLVILALLLCGCGKEEPDPDAINFDGKPTLPVEEITELPTLELVEDGSESNWGFELKTEIGIFRQEDMEGDGIYHFLLTFEDFATGETYPLCPKINCTHDNLDCPAFGQRYHSMYYDGTHLYLVGTEYSETAQIDVVYRQNLDGTDRQVVYRPDNVPEKGNFSMHLSVFKDGKIYYVGLGTVFNPETGDIQTGEQIFIGDLTTGETTAIPIEFNDGSGGSTLTLRGMYGNELILLRTTGNEGFFVEDTYHEMFFLLNVDTGEITVIMEILGGNRAYSCSFEHGLMYFRFKDTPNEINENATIIGDENDTSYSIYDGDVKIVDIRNRKIYQITDIPISHRNGLEVQNGVPYWVYMTYNDDRSVVTKYAQNVQTGETYLYNEIFQ